MFQTCFWERSGNISCPLGHGLDIIGHERYMAPLSKHVETCFGKVIDSLPKHVETCSEHFLMFEHFIIANVISGD